jgi:hypothetical protein
MTEDEYRLAKEAHVSNCTGGSITEINILCGSLVVGKPFSYRSKAHSFQPRFISRPIYYGVH